MLHEGLLIKTPLTSDASQMGSKTGIDRILLAGGALSWPAIPQAHKARRRPVKPKQAAFRKWCVTATQREQSLSETSPRRNRSGHGPAHDSAGEHHLGPADDRALRELWKRFQPGQDLSSVA